MKVSASGAGNSVVTFEGAVPLVFGFQAVRLIFDNGRYRTMKLIDAGGVVAEAASDVPEELREYKTLGAGSMLFGSE